MPIRYPLRDMTYTAYVDHSVGGSDIVSFRQRAMSWRNPGCLDPDVGTLDSAGPALGYGWKEFQPFNCKVVAGRSWKHYILFLHQRFQQSPKPKQMVSRWLKELLGGSIVRMLVEDGRLSFGNLEPS